MAKQRGSNGSDLEDSAIPTTDDQLQEGEDYFLEIESHFAELRGTPFVLSSRDWALMKGWKDEGIPLSIVVEAMDECFEKRSNTPRKRVISSLSYCRHAVAEMWDDRKSLHVGDGDSIPETDAAARLADLAETLRLAAEGLGSTMTREHVLRAAEELRSIRPDESARRIEEKLIKIEEKLIALIERAFPAAELLEIQNELDRELADFQFPDDATRERTRKANLRRRLRGELSIPRLSLFG